MQHRERIASLMLDRVSDQGLSGAGSGVGTVNSSQGTGVAAGAAV